MHKNERRIYRFLHIQAGISFNWIFAGEHAIMRPVECAKSSESNSAAQREESLSRGSKTFPKTISYNIFWILFRLVLTNVLFFLFFRCEISQRRGMDPRPAWKFWKLIRYAKRREWDGDECAMFTRALVYHTAALQNKTLTRCCKLHIIMA